MSINPHRGEVDICLNDQHYVLRPTFQALCSIEQSLELSLIALLTQLPKRALTLEEMASIIHASMTAGQNQHMIPHSELGEHIMIAGVDYVYQQVAKLLISAMGVDDIRRVVA